MESINVFNDTPGLGNVVSKVKPFCLLTSGMDIPTYEQVVGDYRDPIKYPGLVGKKFSRLCGFTFYTKVPTAPTLIFQIVYVPKLKGPLTRNNHGLSGWYCWMVASPNDRVVISVRDMARKYQFDVTSFFHSDVFEENLAVFKDNISYALSHQVKDLMDQYANVPDDDYDAVNNFNELRRCVEAIEDSVPKMDEVQQIVTPETKYVDDNVPEYAKGSAPKVGHAKLAYNADKTYSLIDLDRNIKKEDK